MLVSLMIFRLDRPLQNFNDTKNVGQTFGVIGVCQAFTVHINF